MDHRLIKIKQKIRELTEKIGIDAHHIGYGESTLNGLYIEVEGEHWITYRLMCSGDRGGEELVTIALNDDELLYAVLKEFTFRPASTFAAQKAPRNMDHRRICFEKQEELMGTLKSEWKDRLHKEHQKTLKDQPFDDDSGLRVDYITELRSAGSSYSEAYDQAVKKYPYPQKKK